MQNPAPSGAGFSDVTNTGDFFTLPLDRRCAGTLSRRPGGETLQGFPALRTPEIFSPFRSTGGAQARSLAAPAAKLCKAFRRYGHRRFFHPSARPEVRRRSLAAPAAKLCEALRRHGHRRFFYLSARPEVQHRPQAKTCMEESFHARFLSVFAAAQAWSPCAG